MSTTTRWLRSLAQAALLAVALVAHPAMAGDPADPSILDRAVKDLGLTLLAKPDETSVRMPLTSGAWSFFGPVQPYASLGPRVTTMVDDVAGLALPFRDPVDDFNKGVGFGAGLNWHLSEHLDLFGEYQLFSVRGHGASTDGPLGRRDVDAPGVKGGFSIRF